MAQNCDITQWNQEKANNVENIVKITTSAHEEILQTLCYEVEIEELKRQIDINKQNQGGYPKGSIIWAGATIVFEDFYKKFPHLKETYEKALISQEKEAALEKATKKLIQYILAVASMNKKDEIKINGQDSEIDMKQFESLLCSRDQVADQIKKHRDGNGSITLRDNITINLQDYKNIFDEYKDQYTGNLQNDEKIDAQIAERIILKKDLIVQINNPLIDYKDKNYKNEDDLNKNLNAGYTGLKNLKIETRKIKVQKQGKSYRALQKVDSNNIISTDGWVKRDILANTIQANREAFLNGQQSIDFYGNEKLDINELNVQINSSYQATIGTYYKQEYEKANDQEKIKLDTRLAELAILLKGKMIQIDNYELKSNDPNYKTPIDIKRNQKTCYICLNDITIPVKEKTVTINGTQHYLVYLDRSQPITITTPNAQQQQTQEQTPPTQEPQPQPGDIPPANNGAGSREAWLQQLIAQQRTQQQQQPQNQAPSTQNQTQNTVTQHVESNEAMLSKCVNRDNLATQINNLNGNLSGRLKIRNDTTINLDDQIYQQYIQWYKGTYSSTNDHNKIEKANTELAELLILASDCYIQINNDAIGQGDPNYGNYANKQMNCINEINSHHNSDSKNYPFEVEGKNFNYNNTQYYIVKPKISTIVPPQIPTPPNTGGTGEGIGTINIDNSSNQYLLNIIYQQNNQIDKLTKQIEELKAIIEKIRINGGGGGDQPKPEDKPTGDVDKPEPKPKPKPEPDPNPEPEPEPETPKEEPIEEVGEFELDAVLTDAKDTYQEKVRKEVENEINEDYHNTGQWRVLKKFWTFMSRGFKRKKKIAEKMKGMEGTPFVVNDEEMNQELESIANRHDLEEKFYKSKMGVFGKIQRTKLIDTAKDTINEREKGPGIKDLCQKYLTTDYKKEDFQQDFNEYIQENYDIPKENQFFATNILNKLDTIKADNELFKQLEKNISDGKRDEVKTECNKYFSKYKKDPRFRNELYQLMGEVQKDGISKKEKEEKINKFIKHQKAIANASVNNLRIKMDLLTNGKAAHRINNNDRKNRLFKIGHKFDKLPRWGQLMTAAGIGVAGMGVAALGGGAIAATATTAGLSGLFAAIKKMTHYTKEQNTFEKDLATDYEKTKNKIRQWEATVNNENARRRDRYKAKRQLKLYKEATQNKLIEDDDAKAETTQLVDALHELIENTNSREEIDNNPKNQLLIADIAARLEAYRRTGHNFLRSNDGTEMEQRFYELENALQTISNRYYKGKLDTRMKARRINQKDEEGKDVKDKDGKISTYKYSDLVTAYCTDYSKASKKFRTQLALLGLKYGVGTAIASAGTSVLFQGLRGDGIFAEGPKTELIQHTGTPETVQNTIEHTNTITAEGNFKLGEYELIDNNAIHNLAQDEIADLSPQDTVTLHFGGGTDATPININGKFGAHAMETYHEKLNQVIETLKNSSIDNKEQLIAQVKHRTPDTQGHQVNDLLHQLRCLETIEETVKGSGDFTGTLKLDYNPELTNDAQHRYTEGERASRAWLEITKHTTTTTPGTSGRTETTTTPGTGNKNLIFSIPFFANTFYDDGTPPETKEKEPKAAVKGEEANTDGKENEEPKGGTPDNKKGEPDGKEPKEKEGKPDGNTDNNPDNKNEKNEKATQKPEPQPAETSEPDAEKVKEEIRDNIDKVLKGELEEKEFNERYKSNEKALEQLKQEKEFREKFPTYNFYKEDDVQNLEKKYKDNQNILDHIKEQKNSKLNDKYKTKLDTENIEEKFKDKAKELITAATGDKEYGTYKGKPMIIIKLSDNLTIPFYQNTGKGGSLGITKDQFYPTFGIGEKDRSIQGNKSEINNYYSSPLLAAIAQELNTQIKENKIEVKDRNEKDSDDKFKIRANTGKDTTQNTEKVYDNINKTLDEIAKIQKDIK